jgi:hypothetical protein
MVPEEQIIIVTVVPQEQDDGVLQEPLLPQRGHQLPHQGIHARNGRVVALTVPLAEIASTPQIFINLFST